MATHSSNKQKPNSMKENNDTAFSSTNTSTIGSRSKHVSFLVPTENENNQGTTTTTTKAAAVASSNNRRKRRWGTVTNDEDNTITTGNSATENVGSDSALVSNVQVSTPTATTIDPVRAKILALQESVKARLKAAKAGATTTVTGGIASNAFPLPTTTSASASANTTVISNPNKKAKIYELDLTITGPSYKDNTNNDDNNNNIGQKSAASNSSKRLVATTTGTTTTASKRKQRWGTVENSNETLSSQQPTISMNPYLAHRYDNKIISSKVSSISSIKNKSSTFVAAAGTNTSNQDSVVITESIETKANNDDNDDVVDPRLLVRVSKERIKNKTFNFIEPGLWTQRAEKVRMNQSKIFESGYITGRKKGHTVSATSMAGIYGSGGIDNNDDISNNINTINDPSLLPPRSDCNPDPNHIMNMPLIMEWWDMELIPSKLRKKIATIEQEKEKNSNLIKLQQQSKKKDKKIAATTTTTSRYDDDNDNENNTFNISNDMKMMDGMDNTNNDNDDEDFSSDWMGTHEIQELRQLSYNQASLSHSKTCELIQHIVPIQPKVTVPSGSINTAGVAGSSVTVLAGAANVTTKEIVLHLTKKEMKRQRKLQRREKQREVQDLQAAGLVPTPEPRLTLQNFFQVLGDTAITDPSQIERIVQEQIQSRQLSHIQRNAANKLSIEQRRDKKITKLNKADISATILQQITVALFYVVDVTHPYHRAKLEKNAQQLNITGGVVECSTTSTTGSSSVGGPSAIIVEGNPSSIQRYIRLVTVRMKWNQPPPPPSTTIPGNDNEEDDDDDDEEQSQQNYNPDNRCELIWKGLVSKRNFHGFVFQEYTTSTQARKILKARGVEHYWDRIDEYHRTCTVGGGHTGAQFKLYSSDTDDEDDMKDDPYDNNDEEIKVEDINGTDLMDES